jgi:hypothetical protein
MNAKNPKFAIAPKGEYNSVKSGVKYPIVTYLDGFFEIVSPLTGNSIQCLSKRCSHLDGKNWILRNK